jgi:glycosyltransferase involved in cell wall biosynthesis
MTGATGGSPPAISVVIATYNRSNALELTLRSLIAQTFEDWEAWVVGDACTDDTEEVVGALADPRLRFVNLPRNHGEQSVPTNEGTRRSAGRCIALLNHDDLWFPDHLERAHAGLQAMGADIVFTVPCYVAPDGRMEVFPSWTGRWEPNRVSATASSWLGRREAFDRAGPWRSAREIFHMPSQDWLHRAWAAGLDIRQVAAVTVLAVPSGVRPGSYARRDDHEQRALWRRMQGEPAFREELTTRMAIDASAELLRPRGPGRHLRRVLTDFAIGILRLRIMPLRFAIKYRRRGGYIDHLRELRGLPPR